MTYKPSKVENGRVFLQYSDVAGDPLSASGLRDGELVIQAADGKLYFKSSSGDVENLAFEDAASDGNTYARKDGAWVDLASAAALQFRQGTDAERLAMDPVPASGEPIYTTDTNRFFIGDGTTTGGRGIVTDSDAYVICQPGDDLLAKYTAAKALTPGGNSLSATNRAALIIYPGKYDIGSSKLTIDEDYVDILGLGSATWSPSVIIESTESYDIEYGGEDVVVVGLYSTFSAALEGGAKRVIENCGSKDRFYHIIEAREDGLPTVIQGTLLGCASGLGQATLLGNFCGSPSNIDGVFTGLLRNCYANRSFFAGVVFLGEMTNCVASTETAFASYGISGAMQGWARYSVIGLDVPGESSINDVDPTAYGASCTISNASPAVVTSVAHGLLPGMRIHLATDGALPTGLSAATTYYVKKIDADTFELSSTLNGDSINTSSAGSGSHTVEKPTGKDGGWYTYCTSLASDYTTT